MGSPIPVKRCRISFVANYLMGSIALILVLLIHSIFEIPFPALYIILIPIILLFLEPEYASIERTYLIRNDSISVTHGIISKTHEMIPWRLVGYTILKKNIIGRIFNFGDIIITSASGTENKIVLKGIKNPEKYLKIIEKRIEKYRR